MLFFCTPRFHRFAAAALLAGLIAGSAYAQPGERQFLPPAVLQALQTAAIPQESIAVVVQELSAGSLPQARIRLNAGQPFNPASLMKLLTTYAALELLGPSYTWKTEAWTNGSLAEGVLEGDLILKGGGDPKLTLEQFWLLLRQLRARGVRDIRGDLVLDRSLFDLPKSNGTEAELFDDQPLRPYNVSPDALLLNFKSLRLQWLPDQERKTVALLVEPRPANLDIVNLVKPGPGRNGCGAWREALRADVSYHRQRARLILTGTYPLSCGEKIWHLGVLSHPDYVDGVFRQLWQELGGTLAGGLREAGVPEQARLLASIESPPLVDVVRDINKFSNNVMSRQLYLTLGSASANATRHSQDGATAIRSWLESRELNFPELVLENGSGLSRRERLAADSLVRLLLLAWKSPLMPEFLASLPLVAVDGTMKRRLTHQGIAGQAHVKTGSLEGVKSLAGYVLDRHGRWQVVVFLVNHANAAAAQAAQDALLLWVYQGDG